MYCFKCGNKIEDGSIFCENCGTKMVENVKTKSGKKKGVEIAQNLATSAATTGGKIVKNHVSTGVKIASISAIIAVVLGLVNFYFTYMVETPTDVVQTFTEAVDKQDVKAIVECLDPKFQKQFSVAFGLTGGVLNSMMGTSIDFDLLLDASSAFSEYISADVDYEKCNAKNFKVVKYEGEKLSAFVSQFGNKIPAIGNVLGSSALVEFEMDDNGACYDEKLSPKRRGNKIIYTIKVVKYGKEGWKIPSEILNQS